MLQSRVPSIATLHHDPRLLMARSLLLVPRYRANCAVVGGKAPTLPNVCNVLSWLDYTSDIKSHCLVRLLLLPPSSQEPTTVCPRRRTVTIAALVRQPATPSSGHL